MKFKGIVCLTKVNKNQTQTERNENTIIFNKSKIEILEENYLNLDIHSREVFYIASSSSNKKRDENGNIYYDVSINWLKCIKSGSQKIELEKDVTDILIITQDIYDELVKRGLSSTEIYYDFKEKGLGKMSVELSEVTDFSALVAQIVN